MLSGGAVDASEQSKAKNPPAKEIKERKDDAGTKASKPRVGEARPGRNDDDPRLVRWDVNGDGVLSRSEWKASPQLFDRLDVNRDDMLTRAELAERP
jgi:hypothetical protein